MHLCLGSAGEYGEQFGHERVVGDEQHVLRCNQFKPFQNHLGAPLWRKPLRDIRSQRTTDPLEKVGGGLGRAEVRTAIAGVEHDASLRKLSRDRFDLPLAMGGQFTLRISELTRDCLGVPQQVEMHGDSTAGAAVPLRIVEGIVYIAGGISLGGGSRVR